MSSAVVQESYSIQIQANGDNTAFATSPQTTLVGSKSTTFSFSVTSSWTQVPIPAGYIGIGALAIKNVLCGNPILVALDNLGAHQEDSVALNGFVKYSSRSSAPYIKTTDYGATFSPTVSSGVITAVSVSAGGTNVPSLSTLKVSDASGVGAILVPTIVGGVITAVTVKNGGSGYTAPTITVDALAKITIAEA